MAGRDIKRYKQPESDKYLIFTRRGIEIENYPAILKYLEQYKEKLTPKPKDFTGKNWPGRKPGTYKWYEIQDAVDYYEEFEKIKIIIPAIVKSASYTIDFNKSYSNDKTSIIPVQEFHLLSLLNSKAVDFFLKHIASTKQNGYFEYKPVYVSKLPIPLLSEEDKKALNRLIEERIKHSQPIDVDNKIDQLVYQLFDLSEEEIEIIENS